MKSHSWKALINDLTKFSFIYLSLVTERFHRLNGFSQLVLDYVLPHILVNTLQVLFARLVQLAFEQSPHFTSQVLKQGGYVYENSVYFEALRRLREQRVVEQPNSKLVSVLTIAQILESLQAVD